nr:MAG TPA: hypothetical protein [Caudoviricetes sp.]
MPRLFNNFSKISYIALPLFIKIIRHNEINPLTTSSKRANIHL